MNKVYLITGYHNLALLQTIQEGLAEVSLAAMETLRRGIQGFNFSTEAEERAFARGYRQAIETVPVGAVDYEFLSEETVQSLNETIRRSKELCERRQASMDERLYGIAQRALDALAPAWNGHKDGYPTEVANMLKKVMDKMNNPACPIPPAEEICEALEQARAALPDRAFAKQYSIDPAVITELNEAIDHLEGTIAGPSPR